MRTILTASFCILTFFSFAQKNFIQGFIVTNTSDTLKGFINYVEQSRNPSSILFKNNIEDKAIKKYSVQDLKYFEIEGYEYFTRSVCRISMDQTQGYNIATGEDTTSRIDTVFLRALFFGQRIQLFSYIDKIKTRYFIKTSQYKDPVELIYRRFYDDQNSSMIKESKIYQSQLMQLALDLNILNSQLKNRIETTTYTNYLVSLVKFMNGDSEEKFENAKKNKRSRLFVEGGFNRSAYKFTGDTYHERMKFSTSNAPIIGMGVDLFFNPSIQKLIFRSDVSLTTNSFEGTEISPANIYIYTYELKRYLLSTNFSLIYNLYNAENLKFFIGGGPAFNILLYPKNRYYSKPTNDFDGEDRTPYDFRNYSVDFIGRVGLVFKNKVEVSLLANYPLINTTSYVSFHDVYTFQQARLGYLLSKKKK